MRTLALAAATATLLAASPALAVFQCGDTQDTCQCGANNPYPCCDNGGNCTWYAWHQACCSWGVGLPGWGNAKQWAGNARANASYDVKPFAVTNAVACKDNSAYGHVAFTTALSGSTVTVKEQNCWGNYGARSYSYAASVFSGGYIVRAGQVACQPGDSQTQSCGNCGTQSRGCGTNGAWGGWGACSDQGACHPGAAEETSCGTCGTHARTCTASCTWAAFGACAGPNPAPEASACATGKPGVCAAGALACVEGNLTCQPVTTPTREACDGLDNDCDGAVDGAQVCAIETSGPRDAPGSAAAASAPEGVTQRSSAMLATGSCAAVPASDSLAALGLALLGLAARRTRRASRGRA